MTVAQPTSPAQFTRYYEHSIKEWVETFDMHLEIVGILNRDVDKLWNYSEDYKTDCLMDPTYENSYKGRVIGKTIIRAVQACKKRGDSRTVRTGPALTFWNVAGAILGGIVMGEIASDLWSGKDGKGGVRQHLR